MDVPLPTRRTTPATTGRAMAQAPRKSAIPIAWETGTSRGIPRTRRRVAVRRISSAGAASGCSTVSRWMSESPMKIRHSVGVVGMCALLATIATAGVAVYGQAPPAPRSQPRHPSGKLIVTGDVALFIKPGDPDNCILTNRFKHGQRLGFRMTATDGGTGEPEDTAILTAHLTVGGRKIDVPMRFRGDAPTP